MWLLLSVAGIDIPRFTKQFLPKFFELLPSLQLKLEENDRLGSSRTEALGLEVTNNRSTDILWHKIENLTIICTFQDSSQLLTFFLTFFAKEPETERKFEVELFTKKFYIKKYVSILCRLNKIYVRKSLSRTNF